MLKRVISFFNEMDELEKEELVDCVAVPLIKGTDDVQSPIAISSALRRFFKLI
jgi:hypothetical protein